MVLKVIEETWRYRWRQHQTSLNRKLRLIDSSGLVQVIEKTLSPRSHLPGLLLLSPKVT